MPTGDNDAYGRRDVQAVVSMCIIDNDADGGDLR